MNFAETRKLWDAIERIYVFEPALRTLSNFVRIVGDLKDRLHRWTQDGQYGFLFDNVADMFGPIMIPFLAFDKLAFLFWGWLRAFIGFCFYKVVAAAVLSVLGNLLSHYYMTMPSFADPGMMVKQLPLLILLTLINIYVLFQVPHLTMSIFSGSTGGNGSGMMTTAALLLKA